MPCNLAVTITKAAVADEALRKLLTPEVVKTTLKNALGASTTVYRSGTVVYADMGTVQLSVRQGKVSASYARTDLAAQAKADKLVDAVSAALSLTANNVLALKVRETLRALAGAVETRQVNVNDEGQIVQAFQFTLEL